MLIRIWTLFFAFNWRESILPTGPALLLTLGGVLLSACSTGTHFERPSTEAIVLGKTTPAQITDVMGKPWKKLTTENNGKRLELIVYGYGKAYEPAAGPAVIPAKTLQLTFADGKLVGHDFFSSFKYDHTDFDTDGIKEIEKANHSTEDVLRILGQPTGQQIYPLIDDPEQLRWSYRYHQTAYRMTKTHYAKALYIYFDKNQMVESLDFEEKGNR